MATSIKVRVAVRSCNQKLNGWRMKLLDFNPVKKHIILHPYAIDRNKQVKSSGKEKKITVKIEHFAKSYINFD